MGMCVDASIGYGFIVPPEVATEKLEEWGVACFSEAEYEEGIGNRIEQALARGVRHQWSGADDEEEDCGLAFVVEASREVVDWGHKVVSIPKVNLDWKDALKPMMEVFGMDSRETETGWVMTAHYSH